MIKDVNIILFLCTGNVFRSAFCEKYFNQIYSQTPYLALSRGTDLYYTTVASEVVHAANRYNISLEKHTPILISEDIVNISSEILIMDYSHKIYLDNNYPDHLDKVRFLGQFYDLNEIVEIGDIKRNNLKLFKKDVEQTFILLSKSIDNMVMNR